MPPSTTSEAPSFTVMIGLSSDPRCRVAPTARIILTAPRLTTIPVSICQVPPCRKTMPDWAVIAEAMAPLMAELASPTEGARGCQPRSG
jgi:hypothetical protein